MISDLWDVIVVPFPFVEKRGTKRRPALVLSKKVFNQNGHTVLAMITTRAHNPWPGDTRISEYESAGLSASCVIRLKLFTLDNRLILRKVGTLSAVDRQKAQKGIRLHIT